MEEIAEIVEYLIDNLNYFYEDGFSEWFDSTHLIVINPMEYKDMDIYIHHNNPKPKDDIWQNIGKKVKLIFTLDEISLENIKSHDYFSDGITIKEI